MHAENPISVARQNGAHNLQFRRRQRHKLLRPLRPLPPKLRHRLRLLRPKSLRRLRRRNHRRNGRNPSPRLPQSKPSRVRLLLRPRHRQRKSLRPHRLRSRRSNAEGLSEVAKQNNADNP
jgi:hypothetical protein